MTQTGEADVNQLKREVEECGTLLQSDGWLNYVAFLKRRIQRLQNEVNAAIDEGAFEKARIKRSLMRDSFHLFRSFQDQLANKKQILNKKTNEKG